MRTYNSCQENTSSPVGSLGNTASQRKLACRGWLGFTKEVSFFCLFTPYTCLLLLSAPFIIQKALDSGAPLLSPFIYHSSSSQSSAVSDTLRPVTLPPHERGYVSDLGDYMQQSCKSLSPSIP